MDCFTSPLANSIALAGTLSLSGPSRSGRVGVVKDDNNPTGLKYFKIPVLAIYPWPYSNCKPCVISTGSCEINFTD